MVPEGVNFCVFCRHATDVELLLYEAPDSAEPFQGVVLTSEHNRSLFYWHLLVENLPPHVCCTWRVDVPRDTQKTGRAFDARHELLDPFAHAVSDMLRGRRKTIELADGTNAPYRAIVVESKAAPRLPVVRAARGNAKIMLFTIVSRRA